MRPLSLVTTGLSLVVGVHCFHLPQQQHQQHVGPATSKMATTRLRMAPPPDAPAGSFFNPVPSEDDDNKNIEKQPASPAPPAASDNDTKTTKDLDEKITQLLRQRQKPPRASRPSTINGVPTEKASGFGKPKGSVSAKSEKPFVAIGPPDEPKKKINDPTKPEYDDQGYTLYEDEKTGKKARVFEALVDYPCDFTMKIVGANEGSFVEEMVAVVAEACDVSDVSSIPHSTRVMGKWTSVTVKAPVKSAEMLYTLYEKVDLDPRVKFKF